MSTNPATNVIEMNNFKYGTTTYVTLTILKIKPTLKHLVMQCIFNIKIDDKIITVATQNISSKLFNI
jgi:predicted fused transcriptional regulator/phosphomethylpyrimidine kinase